MSVKAEVVKQGRVYNCEEETKGNLGVKCAKPEGVINE